MKIKHIVLLKFRKQVSVDQIKICLDKIAELKQFIDGIECFSWGKYSSPEGLNQGFEYGFEMLFSNAEARNAYLIHPKHREAVNYLNEFLLITHDKPDVVAFDYESGN